MCWHMTDDRGNAAGRCSKAVQQGNTAGAVQQTKYGKHVKAQPNQVLQFSMRIDTTWQPAG